MQSGRLGSAFILCLFVLNAALNIESARARAWNNASMEEAPCVFPTGHESLCYVVPAITSYLSFQSAFAFWKPLVALSKFLGVFQQLLQWQSDMYLLL